MSNKRGGFKELLYNSIMPKVYGFGASIVIVGAMFKLNHWPGATEMLVIGLSTEAIIFFLSAFEPKHKDPDWSKVYPELNEDFEGDYAPTPKKVAAGDSTSQQLDKVLKEGNIGPELVKSLGEGMRNMAESASQMSKLGNAAVATNEYAKNVQEASKSLVEMNKSYDATVKAMAEMANASKDAKEYHSQVQAVTKNLGALNAVYEMELQDANNHVKNMNKFYGNLSNAMASMEEASKDANQFKEEVKSLTNNLSALNKVYGNMLTAMKG